MTQNSKEPLGVVLARGAFGRCPNCGSGKLFASYLKQVECCSMCGERLGKIRADDGPAWLTILVVGHIMAPIMLMIGANSTWPDWALITAFPSLALILALAVLPHAKGVFIGIIWRSGCAGA